MIMTLEHLCTLAISTNDHPPHNSKAFKSLVSNSIEYLNNWFVDFAKSQQLKPTSQMIKSWTGVFKPCWDYLHSAFIILDMCRFTLATIDYLEGNENFMAIFEPDLLSRDITHLKEAVRKTCTVVRQHAVEQRGRLQKPDAVQKFLQVILGQATDSEDPVSDELRNLIDESWLDQIIDKLRTSWIEALGGIGDIRVF